MRAQVKEQLEKSRVEHVRDLDAQHSQLRAVQDMSRTLKNKQCLKHGSEARPEGGVKECMYVLLIDNPQSRC